MHAAPAGSAELSLITSSAGADPLQVVPLRPRARGPVREVIGA
jgi:hypothetical protein